jgi:hypothetical protein
MSTIQSLQISELILSILCDLLKPLYVFPLNEKLIVSAEFDEWIEVSYGTSLELFIRIINYFNGDNRLLNLFKNLRVKTRLLFRENCSQILVIYHFVIEAKL